MKVILSRHCRVGLDYWEDREVNELVAVFMEFVDVLKMEQEAASHA